MKIKYNTSLFGIKDNIAKQIEENPVKSQELNNSKINQYKKLTKDFHKKMELLININKIPVINEPDKTEHSSQYEYELIKRLEQSHNARLNNIETYINVKKSKVNKSENKKIELKKIETTNKTLIKRENKRYEIDKTKIFDNARDFTVNYKSAEVILSRALLLKSCLENNNVPDPYGATKKECDYCLCNKSLETE